MAKRLTGHTLYRLHDIVRRCQTKPFLAAEMIGDGAYIRPGKRGNLARRRGVEAFRPEKLQCRMNERGARLFHRGLRLIPPGIFRCAHGMI